MSGPRYCAVSSIVSQFSKCCYVEYTADFVLLQQQYQVSGAALLSKAPSKSCRLVAASMQWAGGRHTAHQQWVGVYHAWAARCAQQLMGRASGQCKGMRVVGRNLQQLCYITASL